MKNLSSMNSRMQVTRLVSRVAGLLLLGLVLQDAPAYGGSGPAAAPADRPSATTVRAFPRVLLGADERLEYVGVFSSDGKYKPISKFGLFVDSMITLSAQPVMKPDQELRQEDAIVEAVPPNIELHKNERFVEDVEPPERAVQAAKGHSVAEELRDSVVSFAYGAKRLLIAPQSVTTDSQHRVIVTDPTSPGVHVLAYNPKDSFQIVGGPGRRLQSPNGVAVDDADNIFVSDSERGLILVYDSGGKFLRNIGSFGEEGMFEHPTGIAIDTKAGHLYVVDPPRHTLFVFDLKGKLLARIGTNNGDSKGFSSRTGSTAEGEFLYPQSVLVHNEEVVVLDSKRIHILDLQGNFIREFPVKNGAEYGKGPLPGLFMDPENHIFLSDPVSGTVQEYSHDGQLLRAFGQFGNRMGEFNAPAGMWADSTGRVYIVDARRIQIYQLTGTQ